MSEAARAVGSAKQLSGRPIKPDNGHIWDAMGELYTMQADTSDKVGELGTTLNDTCAKVGSLVDVIGKPGTADGGQPATGIFAYLSDHHIRISKFERMWERGVGAVSAAVAIGAPLLAALWWLAGDRIAALLH